ncbi:hypothetical protein HY489_01560 [Candidatus Woesearchaeota archaeon]|nr:hypothetical protein [Candidatus Woesearchaeota archaeon]
MKKLAIIAILAILIACAPALPARTQNNTTTITETVTIIEAENQTTTETPENETIEAPAEEPKASAKDLPRKEVTEGETVSFPNLKAVDPDGDPISYTFTTPLNEKGFWKTAEGDAGEYVVTITASDGTNTVAQQVLVVVNPRNKAPTIELAEPIEVNEGETITIEPNITDADGDNVNLSYTGWMTGPTKEASYDDSGLHKVVLTASDGTAITTKEVIVAVKNVNRPPQVFELDEIKVKEGQRVIVKPAAKDPDGDTVKYTFDEPLNANGTWTPELGDAGEYDLTFTATDGQEGISGTVHVVVEAVNRAPTIDLASPIEIEEGETVTLTPTVSDPEGDEVRISYTGWMSSETRLTTYEDAGNHKVTITARDSSGNEAKLDVIVSVKDNNRAPIFGAGSFN